MRKLESDGYVYIDGEVRHITERAVLIHDGKREAWIPLSKIEDSDDEIAVGKHLEILIPEWLAIDKGLI